MRLFHIEKGRSLAWRIASEGFSQVYGRGRLIASLLIEKHHGGTTRDFENGLLCGRAFDDSNRQQESDPTFARRRRNAQFPRIPAELVNLADLWAFLPRNQPNSPFVQPTRGIGEEWPPMLDKRPRKHAALSMKWSHPGDLSRL
jgi:hypothetical protein